MTRSDATRPTGTPGPARCSLVVEREAERLYRTSCSCGRLRAIYSTRPAAARAVVRHGDESGRGYSVTHR